MVRVIPLKMWRGRKFPFWHAKGGVPNNPDFSTGAKNRNFGTGGLEKVKWVLQKWYRGVKLSIKTLQMGKIGQKNGIRGQNRKKNGRGSKSAKNGTGEKSA